MTIRSVLAVVATMLVLAGCNDPAEPSASPDPSPPTTTSSTTQTTTPEPQTPEEKAAAAAEAALTQYFKVLDQIGQDPEVPLTRLESVATSTMLAGQENFFRQWREDGWVKTGVITVTKTQVEDVSLDNSDPKAGKVPYVTIVVCTDASDVDVVDRSGKSVVLDSRPEELTTRYMVANYSWKTDKQGGWRIGSGKDEELGACTL